MSDWWDTPPPGATEIVEGDWWDTPPPGAVTDGELTTQGFLNAAQTVGTNMGVEALAGIGGLGRTLMAGPEAGGRYVKNYRDYHASKPSPQGQAFLDPVARAMEPINTFLESPDGSMGNALAWSAQKLWGGDRLQAAGSALGSVLPDAAMLAAGGGAAKAARLPGTAMLPGRAAKEEIDALRIKMKSADADLAGKNLVAGELVDDKLAKEAAKQGFHPGLIQAMKVSSPADKAAMKEMLDVYERGQQNMRYSVLNRPQDVLGQAVRKRVDVLREVNQKAGRDVKRASDDLKGKPIDYSESVDDFLESLKDMDISVTDNGTVITKGSQIEGLTGLENGIGRIVKRMWDTKTPDAYDVHRLKKYIDENVGYGKASELGLSGKTEGALKRLRHNLNENLKQFPDYADANMRYSETVEILREMQQLAGMKTDITELSGDRAFGRVARKVFSNYQSRDQLIAALDGLDKTAMKYGGNFNDDILYQGLFIQEMERKFGSAASASFQGDIEKAIGRTMTEGLRTTITQAAVDKSVEVAQRARGINDKAAVKALRDLLAIQ